MTSTVNLFALFNDEDADDMSVLLANVARKQAEKHEKVRTQAKEEPHQQTDWEREQAEWELKQAEWELKRARWAHKQAEWARKQAKWELEQAEWTLEEAEWKQKQDRWTRRQTDWEREQAEWTLKLTKKHRKCNLQQEPAAESMPDAHPFMMWKPAGFMWEEMAYFINYENMKKNQVSQENQKTQKVSKGNMFGKKDNVVPSDNDDNDGAEEDWCTREKQCREEERGKKLRKRRDQYKNQKGVLRE